MIASEIPVTGTSPPASAQASAADHHGFGITFHEFLSALNPLQYLPVVGTIYRAVTGDVIPDALRRAGSMVVSGLLGGPVGLMMSLASTIVEKVTDIDPEKIIAAQFKAAPATVVAPVKVDAPAAASAGPASDPVGSDQVALTPQQLAAYGVRSGASGSLKLGDLEGADVLNSIQLVRLGRTAAAAYAANQPAAPLAVAVPTA